MAETISGIKVDAGILYNSTPLSTTEAKELENRALTSGESFAYIDINNELCFAISNSVNSIKNLAWHNAYELYGNYVKKVHEKTGRDTYQLKAVLSKNSVGDAWQEHVDITPYLTFEVDDEEEYVELSGYTGELPSHIRIDVGNIYASSTDVSTGAFRDCTTIQQVWLSNRHTYFSGSSVFNGCTNLTGVYFDITPHVSPVKLSGSAFKDCAKLKTIYLPPVGWYNDTYQSYSISRNTFSGCVSLENIMFCGTTKEWQDEVTAPSGWANDVKATYVHCLDGVIDIATGEALEGSGQEFYNTAPAMLSFRSQEPLDEFQEVIINGEVVDPTNYTLEEGSTIVKLSVDYLKTLPVGEYDIEVVSNNAAPVGTFEVLSPDLNEYGFYYDQPYSTPYDEETMDASAFVLRRDGTVDIFAPNVLEVVATSTYTYDSGIVTIGTGDEMLPLQIVNGGNALAIEGIEFSICGGDWMYADADYLYHKSVDDEDNTCYWAVPINRTKSSYKVTLNNINTIPVVLYQTYMDSDIITGSVAAGITDIKMAFFQCHNLKSVSLPASLINMRFALSSCDSLETVYYDGTVEQWNAIASDAGIKAGVKVVCSNDTIVTQ